MSFQVSWVYDLVDKLSPALKTINKNIESSNQSVLKLGRSLRSNLSNFSYDKFVGASKVALRSIGQDIDKLSKKSKEIGKEYFFKASIPLSLLGAKFIKTASDYQESLNKVEVAFGSASDSVKTFANTAGTNFGINKSSALDMAAQFGDMATSMGISQKNAGSLATSLVGLAGDLTSFKNLKGDMAKTALNAIFTGETESLKMLGVVMTETNLKQFALAQGITKKIQQMRQDEKVMLRYNYVMAMTKNAHGDFRRTIDGFANQTRVLNDNFNTLSITLGTILLPYAVKATKKVIELLEKFNQLSPTAQKAILIFAGLAVVLPPLLFFFGQLAPLLFLISSYFLRFALVNPVFAALAVGLFVIMKYGTKISDIFNTIYNKIISIGKALGTGLINKVATGLGFSPIFNEPTTQPVAFQQTASQFTGGLNVSFANMPKQTVVNSSSSSNLNLGINTTYAR